MQLLMYVATNSFSYYNNKEKSNQAARVLSARVACVYQHPDPPVLVW